MYVQGGDLSPRDTNNMSWAVLWPATICILLLWCQGDLEQTSYPYAPLLRCSFRNGA